VPWISASLSNSSASTLEAGWSARLDLEIEQSGAASVLGKRQHFGPLRIQRPFYPEGPSCPHLYVLHPPGGVVGGDRLELDVRIGPGARALLTTPAAQKLYRALAAPSRQLNRFAVAERAVLEWLPSETIAFDGARAHTATCVALERDAALIAWDIICFGRPASALPFRTGDLALHFEISRAGLPLAIDRARVVGGAPVLNQIWGYATLPVFGTLYCVPPVPTDLEPLVNGLREQVSPAIEKLAFTALDDLLVVRAAGSSLEPVRAALVASWQYLRPRVLDRAAVAPRIWRV
jgi:urease accessory protein